MRHRWPRYKKKTKQTKDSVVIHLRILCLYVCQQKRNQEFAFALDTVTSLAARELEFPTTHLVVGRCTVAIG